MDEKKSNVIERLHQTLDDRQLRELNFALTYSKHYAHGTDGHNRLMLIAKLYELLLEQGADGD